MFVLKMYLAFSVSIGSYNLYLGDNIYQKIYITISLGDSVYNCIFYSCYIDGLGGIVQAFFVLIHSF